MMFRSTRSRRGRLRALGTLAVAVVVSSAGTTLGHSPDPILSGLFNQDQQLRYRWRDGAVPPAAMKNAITAAATDSNASKRSRAPTFVFDATGTSLIGYGAGATCGPNGIGCFTRSAPNSFTMWLREHGRVFDWGQLRWCQMLAAPADGCYDAENIALDEFGHVLVLNHHENLANETDYLDAVVQTFSRTRPREGWNAHAYGRCDVASLQREYGLPDAATKVSTCLAIGTVITLASSATNMPYGGSVTLTATLKTGSNSAYRKLKSVLLSGRVVVLQRRSVGMTTWTTVGQMPAGPGAGTYRFSTTIHADADYRAVFTSPDDEGLGDSTSSAVRVIVGWCTKACPVSAPAGSTESAR
jgi:hypothetical protein